VKPQRPYLLRALYEWLIDSNDVPYVLVDASTPDVQVPADHVRDGQIVLNIGPEAVRDLVMEEDYLMCSSRFRGQAFELYLPMASIRAIYGRDTKQGMVFPDETVGTDGIPPAAPDESDARSAVADPQDQSKPGKKGQPPLRLV